MRVIRVPAKCSDSLAKCPKPPGLRFRHPSCSATALTPYRFSGSVWFGIHDDMWKSDAIEVRVPSSGYEC